MKKDHTHITVILDRSGSMVRILDATIHGFNTFLDKQKNMPGHATLSLAQFDSIEPYKLTQRFTAIEDVPYLSRKTFEPRAQTPLYDAIGMGILDTEISIGEDGEDKKPEKVMMVIITDGMENSSLDFSLDKVKEMIGEKKAKLNWEFLFLSSDLNAINDAVNFGIEQNNTVHYCMSERGVDASWDDVSYRVSQMRDHIEDDRLFGGDEEGDK